MIYVTGDTHGYYEPFLNRLVHYDIKAEDTVIVCGDFGFVWGDPEHNLYLKKLSELPFTIAFCDGNHENFEFLNMHPFERDWNGGTIHRVEKNVIHLMRGQIYTLESKTFFTFGGAFSHDKYMRRPRVSWWEEELPTKADYNTASVNLDSVGYKVDYVISHQIPRSFIYQAGFTPCDNDMELTGYFDWLYNELDFSKWFAGHYHINKPLDNGKMNLLFDEVVCI